MNRICRTLILMSFLMTVSFAVVAQDTAGTGSTTTMKGKKTFGFMGLGYYEISNFESLYVPFATSGMKAAGAGFEGFFEYGFTDNFGLNVALGYDRLLYANKFRTQVKENFFIADITGHYYFNAGDTVHPFIGGGIGMEASRTIAPTLDVGGGADFMVSDNVSVRFQLLYKTAIIHHRGEAGLGVAYHF